MGVFDGSVERQNHQRMMLVALLHWIYTTDIDELEISDDYHLPLNESTTVWGFEEAKKHYGYEIQKKGRRMPIANVATWWCQLNPESKHDEVFLFIELSEADESLKTHQPLQVLSRSCSFLQHTLSDRTDSDGNLNGLIRSASEDDVFTNTEERLAQFIRACRNDVSHNFWLETEWGFTLHDHAAICVVTLLKSLLDSWYDQDWYVENRLSAKRCLRVIEGEFGLEWDDENRHWDYDTLNPRYERLQDLTEEGKKILKSHYN